MKNCLDCGFLVEDETELCDHCIDERREAEELGAYDALGLGELGRAGGVAAVAARPASSSIRHGDGTTATMERPVLVEMAPEAIRYRNPARSRRLAALTLVMVAVGSTVALLAGLGMRGDGPLAEAMVDWGFAEPPAVRVPSQWSPVGDPADGFVATMPAGASSFSSPVSATDPTLGAFRGQQVLVGDSARLVVASTDLGRGAPALRAADSEAGLSEMVDTVSAASPLGLETTRRPVPVGEGRAVDSVFVNGFAGTTARARFVLLNGTLYMLLTEGPDVGNAELNAAHAKLIDGFDPAR